MPVLRTNLESVAQLHGVRVIVLCGLYGVFVNLGCIVGGDLRAQLVQRDMAAAHTVVHRKHFHRLLRQSGKMAHNVGNHVHGPAVAQHFVCLGVADWKGVCVRHGLEAFTFRHGQLANDVKSVCQFNGVCLSFDGDPPAANLIDRHLLSVRRLNHQAALVSGCGHGVAFLVVPHFKGRTLFAPTPRHTGRHRIQAGSCSVSPAAVWSCLEGNAFPVRAVYAAALACAQFSVLVRHGTDADGDGNHIVFLNGCQAVGFLRFFVYLEILEMRDCFVIIVAVPLFVDPASHDTPRRRNRNSHTGFAIHGISHQVADPVFVVGSA